MIKKYSILLFFALLAINFISCEENFSPKGEFENQYALTCVVRGDTSLQVAVLYSNYNVDGFNPESYERNSAYDGADIRLWYQDTVYVFKDSSVFNPNVPDSLMKFYYLDSFKPTGKGELLEIVATLKNGKRLKASSFTPARFAFDPQETSSNIPPSNTSTVNILWTSEDANNFYVGKIKVKYFVTKNGVVEEKWFEFPTTFIEEGGEYIPIYPTPSRQFSIAYKLSAINRAMSSISDGDPNKDDYTISNKAIIEVLSLDENLSRYYSSVLEDNNYTVRLNESDYSNVAGGFGLFGSLNKSTKTIRLLPEYIQSFGYKVLFEN